MIGFGLNNDTSKKIVKLERHVNLPVKCVNLKLCDLAFYNSWYEYEGKLYYYKTTYIFYELFMKELAGEFDLKCVNYFLAYNDLGILGIASENFRTFDKSFYNYFDFFKSIRSAVPSDLVKLYEFINSNDNYKDLLDIFSLIAFDIFSGQCDRHSNNIIIELSENRASLAPLTDNGQILDDDYMSNYRSAIGSLKLSYNRDFPLRDTINILLCVPILFEGLEKCLDIDIESYINYTCDKYGVVINDFNRELIMSYFSRKKDVIDRTLSMALKYK